MKLAITPIASSTIATASCFIAPGTAQNVSKNIDGIISIVKAYEKISFRWFDLIFLIISCSVYIS